jgi:hypothetical protein
MHAGSLVNVCKRGVGAQGQPLQALRHRGRQHWCEAVIPDRFRIVIGPRPCACAPGRQATDTIQSLARPWPGTGAQQACSELLFHKAYPRRPNARTVGIC